MNENWKELMEESLWILEGKAFEAKGTTSVEAW